MTTYKSAPIRRLKSKSVTILCGNCLSRLLLDKKKIFTVNVFRLFCVTKLYMFFFQRTISHLTAIRYAQRNVSSRVHPVVATIVCNMRWAGNDVIPCVESKWFAIAWLSLGWFQEAPIKNQHSSTGQAILSNHSKISQ